jgi:hypothetical protein
MPSFTQETIEEWREERVSQTHLPKMPMDDWQLKMSLQVCEDDIREESFRLNCALMSVKNCRSNLQSLKKKRENILKRKAEMENP